MVDTGWQIRASVQMFGVLGATTADMAGSVMSVEGVEPGGSLVP